MRRAQHIVIAAAIASGRRRRCAVGARRARRPLSGHHRHHFAAGRSTGRRNGAGESGASGHPLMTAEAIRAAAANFHACIERLWPAAARRGISRTVFQDLHRLAHARPADHGSARQPAGVHQIVLGLSRHPGDRRAHRAGPRAPRKISQHLRRGGARLRSRPLHHRRDLGCRDQLRHAWRRPSGGPFHRHARLHRPPAELFSRGISLRRWKSSSAATSGPTAWSVRGRAHSGRRSSCRPHSKNIAVDFDRDGRRDVVDSVPDVIASTANNLKERRLGHRPDLGLRGGGAGDFQFPARRSRAADVDPRLGAARHYARRRQAVPAARRPRLSAGAGRRAGARVS